MENKAGISEQLELQNHHESRNSAECNIPMTSGGWVNVMLNDLVCGYSNNSSWKQESL